MSYNQDLYWIRYNYWLDVSYMPSLNESIMMIMINSYHEKILKTNRSKKSIQIIYKIQAKCIIFCQIYKTTC